MFTNLLDCFIVSNVHMMLLISPFVFYTHETSVLYYLYKNVNLCSLPGSGAAAGSPCWPLPTVAHFRVHSADVIVSCVPENVPWV